MIRVWVAVVLLLALLGGAAWASDFITMQGERTIYTVDCSLGQWQGDRCSGKLAVGGRYRYRALKAHNEVIFWVVGGTDPSGKFSECAIDDGRNWTCKPNADAAKSITLQMLQGVPMPGPTQLTRPFHAVTKLRWHLLEHGASFGGTTANAPHTAIKVSVDSAPARIVAQR